MRSSYLGKDRHKEEDSGLGHELPLGILLHACAVATLVRTGTKEKMAAWDMNCHWKYSYTHAK